MKFGNESETLEFKKSTAEIKDACASISAMLNKHGVGTVYFGINPRGIIVGQDVEETTLREVSHRIAQAIKPQIFPTITKEEIDNKAVVKVEVNGDNKPYSSNGKYYIRISDEDRDISPAELKKMFNDHSASKKWERTESEYSTRMIDKNALERFVEHGIKAKRLPEGTKPNIDLVKQLGLVSNSKLNNAGAFLFSNKASITLKMAVFATNEKLTFLDMDMKEDNIMNLIDIAESYIYRNIRWRSVIKGRTRVEIPEIPEAVIREAIANSFAHALYDSNTQHEIDIHPNFIAIYNPGTYASANSPKEYVKKSIPSVLRNELIAKILYLDKSIEQFGSGFKRIDSLCKDAGIKYGYENLDNGFKLIIYRDNKNVPVNVPVNKTEEAVLSLLESNPTLTREELAERTSKTVRTIQRTLTSLKNKGLIKRKGSDKNGEWIIT